MAVLILALALQLGAPPAADAWEHFPVLVWRQDHKDVVPLELIDGLGGVNVERDAEAADVFELGVDFYVGHAPGRDELHLERDAHGYLPMWRRWYRQRDESILVRTPCLTDPATRAELHATLERTLAARDGRHGLGVSLGDEVSLTPWADPLDLCHSSTCLAAWKQWSLERYGRALDYVETDAARLALTAGDASLLGPWLARREFHHDVVCEVLEELAAAARVHPSAPPVGLLGLAGRNAFGNVAVDRALEFCNFIEPYATVDARELTFTLRRPDQRVLRTIFPDERGPDGVEHDVWEHFLRGGDGLVIWSDRVLARRPKVRARLVEVVARIRAHLTQHGRFRPIPQGVAIVHDDRSIALRFLRDALLDGPTWAKRFGGYQLERGTWERDVVRWLRLFESIGAMPGALPLDAVGAATVGRFPLLVLNHVAVLDARTRVRLRDFLGAGGRLVVHGEFAAFDPAGGRLAGDLAAHWQQEFEGQVVLFEQDPSGHSARAAARSWLARTTAVAGPFASPDLPTAFTTWARTADERTVVAILPAWDATLPDQVRFVPNPQGSWTAAVVEPAEAEHGQLVERNGRAYWLVPN